VASVMPGGWCRVDRSRHQGTCRLGDGKPFGARRDVAELAAKMGGDGPALWAAPNTTPALTGSAASLSR